VNELAAALELTDNAVRAHLATLDRDGLVVEAGKRPGVRKPETLYALTPEAEQLFPKAYHLLLNRLLDTLSSRLPSEDMASILLEVGRRLAPAQPAPSGPESLHRRAEGAVAALHGLGGLADLQETDGLLVIRGYSCPLAAVVEHHPEVCRLAEALLTEIVGRPVEETCDRSGAPRCGFRIVPSAS
jgi:predicted ArsR family transcriptional regulator